MSSRALILTDQKNKITDYATTYFYDGGPDITFVATQPESEIDQERVKYFESQIIKRERPFAIILNCSHLEITKSGGALAYDTLQSNNYVLDGHHKLLAYKNLNIHPSITEITYLPKTKEEAAPNLDELTEVLYPWQIEDILKYSSDENRDFLNHPESNLQKNVRKRPDKK